MHYLRRRIWTLLSLFLLAVFAANSFFGAHGLKANAALKARIAGLGKQLKILEEKHHNLEAHTKLLASDNIDPDTLEHEARKTLNFVHQNEQVYIRKTP